MKMMVLFEKFCLKLNQAFRIRFFYSVVSKKGARNDGLFLKR